MSNQSTIVPSPTRTGWIRTVAPRSRLRRRGTRSRSKSSSSSSNRQPVASRNLLLSSGSFGDTRFEDEEEVGPAAAAAAIVPRESAPTTEQVGVVVPNVDPEEITIEFSRPDSDYIVGEWPVRLLRYNRGFRLPYNLVFSDGANVEYTVGEILGSGSFGTVELLVPPASSGRPLFAIKTFAGHNNGDTEVQWVVDERVRSVMVPAKPYHVRGKYVILMAVGEDIDIPIKMRDRKSKNALDSGAAMTTSIVRAVLEMQRTLLQHGLVYSDLKIKNVLVVPALDGGVRVMFTDYGGICRYNGDCIYTFRPPQGASHFADREAAERAVMWWCGMFGSVFFRHHLFWKPSASVPPVVRRLMRSNEYKRDARSYMTNES